MLNQIGTQTITTPRLVLRRFTVDDAEAMHRNWAGDPQVTRYLAWRAHPTVSFTRRQLEDWCAKYADPGFYNWVITLQGQPIGSMVARVREDAPTTLGYYIGRAWWGQGLMPEAVTGVLGFLFEQVGLQHVSVAHAVQNPASGRVALKCGMTYEGIRPGFIKTGFGEQLDGCVYNITAEDWAKRKKA